MQRLFRQVCAEIALYGADVVRAYMAVIIVADTAGQIWRVVDGLSREQLVLCEPEEAQAQGLVRYGDAYPGERWQAPGAKIRPEHVPSLYLAPEVVPWIVVQDEEPAAIPAPEDV